MNGAHVDVTTSCINDCSRNLGRNRLDSGDRQVYLSQKFGTEELGQRT